MSDSDSSESQQHPKRIRAEERHRLALELHDTVGQALTLAKLQLIRMQERIREPLNPHTQSWLQGMLDALIPQLDLAIQTVQAEIFSLRQLAPTEAGLASALDMECQAFRRRTGMVSTGRFEPLTLDVERQELIMLIVREALSNVARHAQATTVEVTLQRAGDRGIVSVRDNGIGMDLAKVNARASIGLQGMQERAVALGGDLAAESTPGAGTRIRVSFPLRGAPKNTSLPD